MKSKRILAILNSTEYFGKERGNVAVYRLLQESCDVKVIANSSTSADFRKHLQGLDVIYLNSSADNRLQIVITQIVYNIRFLILLFTYRPSYIFLNTTADVMQLFFPLWLFPSKIVYRAGDSVYGINNRFRRWKWKTFLRHRCTTLVAISNFVLSDFIKSGRKMDADNKVIFNISTPRNAESYEAKCDASTHCFTYGYLGQIYPAKGVHYLVDAFKQLVEQHADCKLLIAGPLKNRDYVSRITATIREANLQRKITLLGEITDIAHFFANIDVLCVPSICQEALSNVISEAKYHHTPCIIFPSGGMPELVTHLRDGYICKEATIDALTDGMHWMINNQQLLPTLSSNAYQSITYLGITLDAWSKKWKSVFQITL